MTHMINPVAVTDAGDAAARDARARRAVAVFRGMQPMLTGYAQALTGRRDVRVVMSASSNGKTDGKNIMMRPPIALGDPAQHERTICNKRDENKVLLCPACEQREKVILPIYHEIAHLAYGTFLAPDDVTITRVLKDAVRASGSRFAKEHRKKLSSTSYKSYLEIAANISEWLPFLLNALEDARIDSEMFRARPGTKVMYRSLLNQTRDTGIETQDPRTGKIEYIMWSEQPVNYQVIFGCYCVITAYDFTGWFHEDVNTALADEQLTKLLVETRAARTVHETYRASFGILERLRELGFCRLPDDPEDEELDEEEPESGESDSDETTEGDESSDEKDSEGDSGSSDSGSDGAPSGGSGNSSGSNSSSESEDEEPSDADTSEEENDGGRRGDEDSSRDDAGDSDGQHEDSGDDADDSSDGSTENDTDEDGDSDSETSGRDDHTADDELPGEDDSVEESDVSDDASSEQDASQDSGEESRQPRPEDGEPDGIKEYLESAAGHKEGMTPAHPGDNIKLSRERRDAEDGEPLAVGGGGLADAADDNDRAIIIAIIQGIFFDRPSANILGVREHKAGNKLCDESGNNASVGWGYLESSTIDVPESVLGKALQRMRIALSDNYRRKVVPNLKSGRVNSRVLGRRAPVADDRLFLKRTKPGRRKYMVVLGVDISGSTQGTRIERIKRAVYAQAELCHRLGVDFAIYAHTGSPNDFSNYWSGGTMNLMLDIYLVKEVNEPWNEVTQRRLRSLEGTMANLDGHTLEYYRKVLDKTRHTDKIICYYTDGAMPAENYQEELEILLAEVKTCKLKKYVMLFVGVNNNEPQDKYGLETVRLDTDEDVIKVVDRLGELLLQT